MVIDKIGNINNIVETKKSNPVSGTKETKKKDIIQISTEGKLAAEVSKITQAVKDTSDLRVERVREIKEKIANGTYDFDNATVMEQAADRITSFLMRK